MEDHFMTTDPDVYFVDGCGRCPRFATSGCKVRKFSDVLISLRALLVSTALKEEAKWGMPCYTFGGKNVILLGAFKDYCAVTFFKGVLLADDKKILTRPTPFSHADRAFRCDTVQQVTDNAAVLEEYIKEAIRVETSGMTIPARDESDYPVCDEFKELLENDPNVRNAFENLTPGRRKGYLIYFSQAKQSKTRRARIERNIPKIMAALGIHERFG